MREHNNAIVSSSKTKFEEFKEEDHGTTSVSSSEEIRILTKTKNKKFYTY